MATILIVEDEESLACVVTHCLREAGHTPIVARTGEAALREAGAHLDLILLDLGLPDIPGTELLRRWKRQPETAQIPVVIASGQPDAAAVVAEGGAHAVAAILRKPVCLPELRTVVDAVLHAPADWEEWAGQAGQEQRVQVLYRLITEGSNRLVRQVCLRLEADRPGGPQPLVAPAPSWADLVHAAKGEGLLSDAEGSLLAAGPGVLVESR